MKSIDYNDKRFKELKVVSLYVQNLNNKENKHFLLTPCLFRRVVKKCIEISFHNFEIELF